MSQHTPGPWEMAPEPHSDTKWYVTGDGVGPNELVAIVKSAPERLQANARLIAAAPELLDALTECLPDLEHYAATHGPGPDRRLAKAKAALHKARGEDA